MEIYFLCKVKTETYILQQLTCFIGKWCNLASVSISLQSTSCGQDESTFGLKNLMLSSYGEKKKNNDASLSG